MSVVQETTSRSRIPSNRSRAALVAPQRQYAARRWLQEATVKATPALSSLAWVASTAARLEAPRRMWISTGVSVAVREEGAAMRARCHGRVMHERPSA
uniref:Uncharacterized protein n=1 Tax=Arundo donax TaxID=35708 RepID=A0A0A9DEY0_ARUDO